jgi:ABC-type multidrug transport system fused ATPase/permease subunit
MAALVSGIGIAFYKGADYAAVCLAFLPFLIILMAVFGSNVKKSAIAKAMFVKKLCGAVEESLTAVRLIASFANEKKEE